MNDTFIKDALKSALEVMDRAHLVLPKNSTFEIYHHYGYENFKKIGAVFLKVVNKEYCKSYVIMLGGQKYPPHYHKIKQETFYILYGDLTVVKENTPYMLFPGEMLDVERLEAHSFYTETGTVFEEISTTYLRNDSIYIDENIRKKLYNRRKTIVSYDEWEEMCINE